MYYIPHLKGKPRIRQLHKRQKSEQEFPCRSICLSTLTLNVVWLFFLQLLHFFLSFLLEWWMELWLLSFFWPLEHTQTFRGNRAWAQITTTKFTKKLCTAPAGLLLFLRIFHFKSFTLQYDTSCLSFYTWTINIQRALKENVMVN